jgi:RNA 2',3'-cyclic 3'-phosphodiesterase
MAHAAPSAPSDAPVAVQLFTALWPDETVQKALAASRDSLSLPAAARPVAAQRLHMALHSLGSWQADRLSEIAKALPPIRRGFEMRLAQIERWPGDQLVLCPDQDIPELKALCAQQAQALQRAGLRVNEEPVERPHVVLARHCRGSFRLKPVDLRWRISGYALVCARSDGSFEVLQRYAWA